MELCSNVVAIICVLLRDTFWRIFPNNFSFYKTNEFFVGMLICLDTRFPSNKEKLRIRKDVPLCIFMFLTTKNGGSYLYSKLFFFQAGPFIVCKTFSGLVGACNHLIEKLINALTMIWTDYETGCRVCNMQCTICTKGVFIKVI